MRIAVVVLVLGQLLVASGVYEKTFLGSYEQAYNALIKSFKSHKLAVTAEVNILEKFKDAGLPEKFGKSFNTNHLTQMRAIIACSGEFGNKIANIDPAMMSLCPIRLTVIEQEGKATAYFAKPSLSAVDSKAYDAVLKLEEKVIQAIEAVQ